MTTLKMPKVDRQILKNRDNIIKDISNFTKKQNILAEKEELKPYETDGLTAYKQTPMLVVLPETTQEVSKILSYCNSLFYLPDLYLLIFHYWIKIFANLFYLYLKFYYSIM